MACKCSHVARCIVRSKTEKAGSRVEEGESRLSLLITSSSRARTARGSTLGDALQQRQPEAAAPAARCCLPNRSQNIDRSQTALAWVIPPASPAATLLLRMKSRSDV